MKETVTIIVPVYKSEAFLNQCIGSILNQTYKDIELILVDDGSPDKSGAICEAYAKKDSRVIIIHKENGGTCEARNVGLERATGKYIMFADGDDWLAEDCIEYLIGLLKTTNSEMAMTDCVFTTRNMKQNTDDWVKRLTPEQAACEILYVNTPVGPWNKIYTTDVIRMNNITFSVPWFGEGLYFSVMAAQCSNAIAEGHKKVYIYRKNNPNSGTTVRNVQNGINSINNILHIKKKLIVNTPNTRHAADWHIWNNYFNLLVYIMGAHAENDYKKEYHNAIQEIRWRMPNVLIHSDVGIKKKIMIIGLSLFSCTAARCAVWIKLARHRKDIR